MARPRTTPRTHNQRYVRCTLCLKEITLNNLSTHLKGRHPGSTGPRRQYFAELDQPPARASVERAAVVARSSGSLPTPIAELPPLRAEDLDEIVIAVVQQLADPQGRIPASFLPAIFAWRAATSTFLRAVSRE